jgi:hypothetical protein
MLAAACTGGGRGGRDSSPTTTPPPASTTATTADPSPSPSRTGPLTTGPNVRPGEQPPVLPDAAKEHSPAGALLFAGYYLKALDWSIATNDPYLVEKISAANCSACNRAISGLKSLRGRGGHVVGGRIQVTSAKIVTGTFKIRSELVVEVFANEETVVLVEPSSARTTARSVRNDASLVFLSWAADDWKVIDVGAPS